MNEIDKWIYLHSASSSSDNKKNQKLLEQQSEQGFKRIQAEKQAEKRASISQSSEKPEQITSNVLDQKIFQQNQQIENDVHLIPPQITIPSSTNVVVNKVVNNI